MAFGMRMLSTLLFSFSIVVGHHGRLVQAVSYKIHGSSDSGEGDNFELVYIKGDQICEHSGSFSKDTTYTCSEASAIAPNLWDTDDIETSKQYLYAYGSGDIKITKVGSRNYFKLKEWSNNCGNSKGAGRTCFKLETGKLYELINDNNSDSFQVYRYGADSDSAPTWWRNSPCLVNMSCDDVTWTPTKTGAPRYGNPTYSGNDIGADDTDVALFYGDSYCDLKILQNGGRTCTLTTWGDSWTSGNHDMYITAWRPSGGDTITLDTIDFPGNDDIVADGTRFWRFQELSDGSHERMSSVCAGDHDDAGRDKCLRIQAGNVYKVMIDADNDFPFDKGSGSLINEKANVPVVLKLFETSKGEVAALDKWLCEKGLDTSRCSHRLLRGA